jgi:hypothetical protein
LERVQNADMGPATRGTTSQSKTNLSPRQR